MVRPEWPAADAEMEGVQMRRGLAGQGRPTPLLYLVDDDPDIAESLRFLLVASGWSVLVFNSSLLCLEALEQRQPLCVITDLQMPFMDGIQLHKAVRERGMEMPVLLMTGSLDRSAAARARAARIQDVLPKPLSIDRLNAAILGAMKAIAAGDDRFLEMIPARLHRLYRQVPASINLPCRRKNHQVWGPQGRRATDRIDRNSSSSQ